MFIGPWRDDATPKWAAARPYGDGSSRVYGPFNADAANSYAASSGSRSDFPYSETVDLAASLVFDGNGSDITLQAGGPSIVTAQMTQQYFGAAGGDSPWLVQWNSIYATLARPDGRLTNGGSGLFDGQLLPPDVYSLDTQSFVDPNVVGIEWEFDPPPLAHRLRCVVELQSGYGALSEPPGINFRAKQVLTDESVPPAYSFLSVNELTTGPDMFLDAGRAPSVGGTAQGQQVIWNDPFGVGPDEPLRLRVTALDDSTITETAYPVVFGDTSTQWGGSFRWSATLEQQYHPSYRLYYAEDPGFPPATEPVTRLWPRDDSRGEMGSATRLYPPPRASRVYGGYN